MTTPEFGNIYVAKLSKTLAGKLEGLRGNDRRRIEEIINSYDQDVDQQCQTIQSALNHIVQKQRDMSVTFGELIDVLLADGRHGEDEDEGDEAGMEPPRKNHAFSVQVILSSPSFYASELLGSLYILYLVYMHVSIFQR